MKSISGKQLCKILLLNGWELKRISGSHHIFYKEGFYPVTVPVHTNKDLPISVLKSILKATNLTENDL